MYGFRARRRARFRTRIGFCADVHAIDCTRRNRRWWSCIRTKGDLHVLPFVSKPANENLRACVVTLFRKGRPEKLCATDSHAMSPRLDTEDQPEFAFLTAFEGRMSFLTIPAQETTSPTSNARDILQGSNQYLSTARFLMATPPRPTQLAPEKQALLDDLLDQNSEGTISPDDQATLIDLVAEAEQLMVENSRRLARFARSESPAAPTDAMPVTVWIKPSSAE